MGKEVKGGRETGWEVSLTAYLDFGHTAASPYMTLQGRTEIQTHYLVPVGRTQNEQNMRGSGQRWLHERKYAHHVGPVQMPPPRAVGGNWRY